MSSIGLQSTQSVKNEHNSALTNFKFFFTTGPKLHMHNFTMDQQKETINGPLYLFTYRGDEGTQYCLSMAGQMVGLWAKESCISSTGHQPVELKRCVIFPPSQIFNKWVCWLFYVTINKISVIHMMAHRCAGRLKKLALQLDYDAIDIS